jgi:hypothetical protein
MRARCRPGAARISGVLELEGVAQPARASAPKAAQIGITLPEPASVGLGIVGSEGWWEGSHAEASFNLVV